MSSIESPEDLEARLSEYSDGLGTLLQEFVSEVGLEDVVGAIEIETTFRSPVAVPSADATVVGIASRWTAPGYIDELSEQEAVRNGTSESVGRSPEE